MTALADRAMLAKLSIGSWSGKAVDRTVTEEVNESYKASKKEAGHYTKQLVASRFFKEIGAVSSAASKVHKVLTLPWTDDGTRILSNTGYDEYTKQMRLLRHKFEANTIAFVKGLPDYVAEARDRLGQMFDAADYPTAEEIQEKFSFDVEINKIPEASDFRAKLSDATVKAIVKDIERRTNARVEKAMDDVYERIYKATEHMAEKLKNFTEKGQEGVKFRDSLVYNIHELADLIPCLNITGDKRLEDLQKRLKEDLTEHSPEILRSNAKIRAATAIKAQKIANKAKSYFG